MRPRFTTLLGICGIFLISAMGAACRDEPTPQKESAPREQNPLVSQPQLAFNIWKCEALECLDLETLETSTQTYTACASVLQDAHEVGVDICERKTSNVVSRPGRCEPLGSACPSKRSAYNWDDATRDEGLVPLDGGASPPPQIDSGSP